MPFGFLRRKGEAAPGMPETAPVAGRRAQGVPFDGLTEEWRLVGLMHIEGRLSDALNRRETITISDVRWAPVGGGADLTPAPGLKAIDPYDLIVVLAGPDSLPTLTDAERAAHKVHKIAYDVSLEAPPFRVIGTVYLYPGSDPDRLLDRATEMFIPVTQAVALYGDREVSDPDVEIILVNRFYLRGVEQVDKRTRQPAAKLPGSPLGGTSWRERSR